MVKWIGAVLLCLCSAPTIAHAGSVRRHWVEIDGLRFSNATLVTKDGHRYRGHLIVTQAGVVVIHYGTYEKWLTTKSAPEIPRSFVARILVRYRYKLTVDELDDLWWYVAADWKAIFCPELSNLFPIATVAHAGFTAGALVYTPVAVIAALCHPPASDTIEVLPD